VNDASAGPGLPEGRHGLSSPTVVSPSRLGGATDLGSVQVVYRTDPPRPRTPSRFRGRIVMVAVGLIVVLGAALRLAWPLDIEYKADEEYTFLQTQAAGGPGSFPALGMPSSAGVRNPGLSVWVFILLAKLSAAHDPVRLAQAVQGLNVVALGLLVWFAYRVVPRREREPWLWAAALAAVCPLAVLFHRKIWPPSVLPVLSLLLLLGWWRRERRRGAFLWGVLGPLMGQIHMSGFFLAAGFAGWAAVFDRRRVAWSGWLAGSVVGTLPMAPWFHYLLTDAVHEAGPAAKWSRLLELKFWTHWVTEPLGLGLKYTFGNDFADFLRYPLVYGMPTYLVGSLHVVLFVIGLAILARASYRLWQDRGRWRDLAVGRDSATAFTQNAALWGFGLLLTLPCLPFQRHYLIIAFPLLFVWLARTALGPRRQSPAGLRLGRLLLGVLCGAELLLSVQFLHFVHVNQRVIQGHYQMPYRGQITTAAKAG
jgi:hypothetical protein